LTEWLASGLDDAALQALFSGNAEKLFDVAPAAAEPR
jgi:hypothetical protein